MVKFLMILALTSVARMAGAACVDEGARHLAVETGEDERRALMFHMDKKKKKQKCSKKLKKKCKGKKAKSKKCKACKDEKVSASPPNPAYDAVDCATLIAAGEPTCEACCPYECTEGATPKTKDFGYVNSCWGYQHAITEHSFARVKECVCVIGTYGEGPGKEYDYDYRYDTPRAYQNYVNLPAKHGSCAFVSGDRVGVVGGDGDDHIVLLGGRGAVANGGKGDDHIMTYQDNDSEYVGQVLGGKGTDTVEIFGEYVIVDADVEDVITHKDGVVCEEDSGWVSLGKSRYDEEWTKHPLVCTDHEDIPPSPPNPAYNADNCAVLLATTGATTIPSDPSDCETYFDGCNTCYDFGRSCTEMFCMEYEEARCLSSPSDAAGASTCDVCCPYSCEEKSTDQGFHFDFRFSEECVCVTGDLSSPTWQGFPYPAPAIRELHLPKRKSSCAFVSGSGSEVHGGRGADHIAIFKGTGTNVYAGDGADDIKVFQESAFVDGGDGDDAVDVYGEGWTYGVTLADVENIVEHDGVSCEGYEAEDDWYYYEHHPYTFRCSVDDS